MASSAEERVALVRTGHEAYGAGDIDTVLAMLDPEVEVFAPPEVINSGTFHGHEGWRRWVEQWNEAWDSFEQEIQEVAAIGERHVIVRMHQTGRGRGSGVEVQLEATYVYEIRDGRAVYLAIYLDRDAAVAAALAREGPEAP